MAITTFARASLVHPPPAVPGPLPCELLSGIPGQGHGSRQLQLLLGPSLPPHRNRKPGQPDIAGSTTRSQVPLKSAFKKRPFLTKGKVPRPRKSVQWHELSELFIVSRWIEPEPEDEAIPEEDEPEDNQDQGQEQVDDPDQLALLAELEELWF
ncbi:hypothetical protein MMC13_005391 [Lambiella insularis]|nr:hypothetical protein [Lambiella insularis]